MHAIALYVHYACTPLPYMYTICARHCLICTVYVHAIALYVHYMCTPLPYMYTICARHCIIQCKVVHRVHWSKCKLARIDPTIDPECDRCHLCPTTLTHMFWTCPALSLFHGSVFNSLTAITSADIPPSPIIGCLVIIHHPFTSLTVLLFVHCSLDV